MIVARVVVGRTSGLVRADRIAASNSRVDLIKEMRFLSANGVAAAHPAEILAQANFIENLELFSNVPYEHLHFITEPDSFIEFVSNGSRVQVNIEEEEVEWPKS